MTTADPLETVRAAVRREPVVADDRAELAGRLQRLCRAACRELSASGVGLSLMNAEGAPLSVAASSADSQEVEELQFTIGEGPCLDAFASRGPVLVSDLEREAGVRWPGYCSAALDLGVRAVFAFPLQVGAARLGVLDVYRDRPGTLTPSLTASALDFAELALIWLLDSQYAPESTTSPIDDALIDRSDVYQAQGMVMVQLGVDLPTAMVRLRAHAYAHGLRLGQVAADVVARRLTFEVDDE